MNETLHPRLNYSLIVMLISCSQNDLVANRRCRYTRYSTAVYALATHAHMIMCENICPLWIFNFYSLKVVNWYSFPRRAIPLCKFNPFLLFKSNREDSRPLSLALVAAKTLSRSRPLIYSSNKITNLFVSRGDRCDPWFSLTINTNTRRTHLHRHSCDGIIGVHGIIYMKRRDAPTRVFCSMHVFHSPETKMMSFNEAREKQKKIFWLSVCFTA